MHKSTILLILLIACSKPGQDNGEKAISSQAEIVYRKSEYGHKWPFAVNEIIVYCINSNEVYFRAEGKFYPLNGKAISSTSRNFDEVWLDSPQLPGTKIPVPPEFIGNALKNCN